MGDCRGCCRPRDRGHAPDCEAAAELPDEYASDVVRLPELCAPVFSALVGDLTVQCYRPVVGRCADSVVLPLPLFRALLDRRVESQLDAIERAVERLLDMGQPESARCLECGGAGSLPHRGSATGKATCAACLGSGRCQ